MSLINDDGEMVILAFRANLRNDVREFLDRGDDNTLSIRKEKTKAKCLGSDR